MSTRFGKKQIIIACLLVLMYGGLFFLSAYLREGWGVTYALGLIGAILFGNVLYSVLYFVNEFRHDGLVSGRVSLEVATKIQRRKRYLTWYWVVLVNCSQLFVFAFLFQYFYQLGGGKQYFTFSRELTYLDWVLYTLDCTFKSLLDIPEIFDLHIRNIRHHGWVGGATVTLVRFLIYTMLITALLRQWNKWRQFRETLHAINVAPELAGRRLLRMGEEAIKPLDRALLEKNLFQSRAQSEEDLLKRDEHSEPLVQMLLRNLTVGDAVERRNAAVLAGLLRLQDASEKPYFLQLLQLARREPEVEVRKELVHALGQIGDIRTLPVLRGLLSDPEPLVREGAARALGHLQDHRAIRALGQALSDEDSDVRVAAARALGRIGSKNAIPALHKALGHEDERVAQEVVFSLAFLDVEGVGPQLTALLRDKDDKVKEKALTCIRKLQPAGIEDALVEVLNSPEATLRALALQALAELALPRATEWSLTHTKDADPTVRRVQIAVWRESRDEACIPHLLAAARDEDLQVRERAIRALGDFDAEASSEGLLALLAEVKDAGDKVLVIRTLGQMRRKEAYEPLQKIALGGDDLHQRRQAIRALVWIDSSRAYEDLTPLAKDKKLQEEIVFSMIGTRRKEVIPHLLDTLEKVREPRLCDAIWSSIEQIGRQDLKRDRKAWRAWWEAQQPAAKTEAEEA